MTRTMGDAIHDNVAALHAANLQMVAGYVTGSPDILWTAADWALFPGIPHVTIDQGFTGSPVATAMVRDVEQGAWSVGNAVNRSGWTAARPTIYCSASELAALAQAGWKGDVWVADYVSTAPSAPYAVPAGMTSVAWQWTNTGGGGAYDVSVVFDPNWPEVAPVPGPAPWPAPAGLATKFAVSMTASWAATGVGANYSVQLENAHTGAIIETVNTSATSYTFTGLAPNTHYAWRVLVHTFGGRPGSAWSGWESVYS